MSVFPNVIIDVIVEYTNPMKLLDWIPLDKLIWMYLSSNPNAMDLLYTNKDKIKWNYLSTNPGIFEIDTRYTIVIEQLTW